MNGIAVGDVRAEGHGAVMDIAERSFRYSRFHQDPQVPRALANRIKRERIASYTAWRQRGERLLVAGVDGGPVGFFAMLTAPARDKVVPVIDLVAVSPENQGLGVRTALAARFVELARAESDVLEVGTQIANLPSIPLYLRFGATTSCICMCATVVR